MTQLKPFRLVMALLFASLVLAACTATPTPTPTATPTATPVPTPLPPQLSGYSTMEREVHPPMESFIIAFNQPMDLDSVGAAFSISPEVEGSLSRQNDRTVRFVPGAGGFARDTEYVVTIGTEARSEAGRPVTEPIVIRSGPQGTSP